jgi:transposase
MLGLLLHALVPSAHGQDRGGGILLLLSLADRFPWLKKLFAAGAYQGPVVGQALAKVRPQRQLELSNRSAAAPGFVVVPQRWMVERTLAWLHRCRRWAKDFENRLRIATAFVQLAALRLMLRKLGNPS